MAQPGKSSLKRPSEDTCGWNRRPRKQSPQTVNLTGPRMRLSCGKELKSPMNRSPGQDARFPGPRGPEMGNTSGSLPTAVAVAGAPLLL